MGFKLPKIIRRVAPIVGGIFGGPAIGAAVGAAVNLGENRKKILLGGALGAAAGYAKPAYEWAKELPIFAEMGAGTTGALSALGTTAAASLLGGGRGAGQPGYGNALHLPPPPSHQMGPEGVAGTPPNPSAPRKRGVLTDLPEEEWDIAHPLYPERAVNKHKHGGILRFPTGGAVPGGESLPLSVLQALDMFHLLQAANPYVAPQAMSAPMEQPAPAPMPYLSLPAMANDFIIDTPEFEALPQRLPRQKTRVTKRKEPQESGNLPRSVLEQASEFAGGGFVKGGYVYGESHGSADDVKTQVPAGTYVWNATDTSLLGNGSSENGARQLLEFQQHLLSKFPNHRSEHRGKMVDVLLSPAEVLWDPETVEILGEGSLKKGAQKIMAARKALRKHKKVKDILPPNAKPLSAYFGE